MEKDIFQEYIQWGPASLEKDWAVNNKHKKDAQLLSNCWFLWEKILGLLNMLWVMGPRKAALKIQMIWAIPTLICTELVHWISDLALEGLILSLQLSNIRQPKNKIKGTQKRMPRKKWNVMRMYWKRILRMNIIM